MILFLVGLLVGIFIGLVGGCLLINRSVRLPW
jgi:hypothetical protein